MAQPACDDCAHGCRDGCAYVRPDEQPYFQAFRLAHRLLGDDWKTWDFVAWIGEQWRAFERERGHPYDHFRATYREEFQSWLFGRVGHPRAA